MAVISVVVLVGGASATGGRPAPAQPLSVRASVARSVQPRSVAQAELAAAWCGSAAQSDRVPNVVAGNPIHWIYLIPSDGPDDLARVAGAMQSDADEIDGWWRGQDPTRVPRNDVARFSCGDQLDISTARSTRSSAQLTPLGGRFAAIADTVARAGFTSTQTKYLVFYDGPIDDDNVCGQGGSDGTGFGVAVVYYRSCVGVSTAAVAAHEFLHTIGAVPSGAPHECTGDDNGHTCDDARDLMYPAIGGDPLSAKILDPGRDDYYGHPSSWLDTQDSAWLIRLDSQTPLALTISGPGSVKSDVPGLQCAASCTTTWNTGQRLTLTGVPRAGSKLVRWSGACSGKGLCNAAVTAGATVSALFAPARFRLSVSVAGQGTVRSSRAGITCRPRCTASFPSFTPVRLTAIAVKGWTLRSWSGACKGAEKTCTVPMTAASAARAVFARS